MEKGRLRSTHFRVPSLTRVPSQALHLILHSVLSFFPKEGLKFHRLQVPQTLTLFQVVEVGTLKTQSMEGQLDLSRPVSDLE